MRYRLSSLADLDLDEIWLYVADDVNVEAADRLIDLIVDRFSMLAAHPKIGTARPELGLGTRCFVVDRYLIYYREELQHLSDFSRCAWKP